MARQAKQPVAREFWLDEDRAPEVTPVRRGRERWCELPHCTERRRGLLLAPGDSAWTPPIAVGDDHAVEVACLAASGRPRLRLRVHDVDTGRADDLLASDDTGRSGRPRRLRGFLDGFAGRVVRIELQARHPLGTLALGQRLGIETFSVADAARLPLMHARSHRRWRTVNELAHFGDVYRHPMYRDDAAPANGGRPIASRDALAGAHSVVRADEHARLAAVANELLPRPGETAFRFAHWVLERLIGRPPPDFAARARAIADGGPLRVLSLCSGAARIERGLFAQLATPVDLTLVDIHRGLLQEAAAAMPEHVRVRAVEADVNELPTLDGPFDVALCVSGLHHVVELEHVLATTHAALRTGGEFWAIGEQVGRNGNRLMPADYEAADRLFASLPAELRRNRNTGVTDEHLPHQDCSTGCYEGIRSEDILPLLDRHFGRRDVYQRNCFLWRLVDLAYADNYELDDPDHLDVLRRLAVADHEHVRGGGAPAELNGVFDKRR